VATAACPSPAYVDARWTSVVGSISRLVVMGGRTQHEWQHTVPKAAKAGARMSITMRHSRPLG